jgi:hypothetical protein
MLTSFNLVILVILMYSLLLFAIEKGYTNAYVLPGFFFPFSVILPFTMFILALMCNSYNKKKKFQLIINGLILMFYPIVQTKLYRFVKQQMKKGQQNEQQNEQQNNNNVVVV